MLAGNQGRMAGQTMFDGTQRMIDSLVERLERAYHRNYGTFEPSFGEILPSWRRLKPWRVRSPSSWPYYCSSEQQ